MKRFSASLRCLPRWRACCYFPPATDWTELILARDRLRLPPAGFAAPAGPYANANSYSNPNSGPPPHARAVYDDSLISDLYDLEGGNLYRPRRQ